MPSLTMPTLSLCMIVRNEEANLKRCLQSVQGLVDEIVIVDTGSTDKTKEIAQKFSVKCPVKIFDFSWNNDFAAARNVSLQQATSDWILMLDADEVLAAQDHLKIKEAVQTITTVAFTLILRNYTNDSRAAGWVSAVGDSYVESKIASGWWEVSKVRLFRNREGIRYQGKVHESVYASLAGRGDIVALPVPLHHYGKLDPAKAREKYQLYESIGLQKVAEEPDFSAYLELGRQYLNNNKVEEAITALKKSLELQQFHSETWFLLGTAHLLREESEQDLNQDLKQALAALEKAWILNLSHSPTYTNLGILYTKYKNFEQAMEYFLQAIEFNPRDANAWKNLGMCFDELGDKEKAYRALKKAVELNPSYGESIQLER